MYMPRLKAKGSWYVANFNVCYKHYESCQP